MEKLYEIDHKPEKLIMVAVASPEQLSVEESLDELEELILTAGGLVAGRCVQNREQVHPGTYVGKGKIEELEQLIRQTGATGIVCDDELTTAQLGNLHDLLDVTIMDRTLVILDIFAARAKTKEGKVQVELAQLRYRSSRLVGLRDSFSRLGGGIGTRGPGEKKLEVDRRLIRERISQLSAELRDVERHREIQRRQRSRNRIPVICMVGYTNVGKSTLLNHLTNAGVLEEDQLFATLDPTVRELILPSGRKALLTDTVGFIRKLPHPLIQAFHSTLEEAVYSDVILHVVDASSPQMETQMDAVYETLRQLEVKNKPVVTAFNKIDRLSEMRMMKDPNADYTIKISAREEIGLDGLCGLLERVLRERTIYIEKTYPYEAAGTIQLIRRYGQLQKEEYRDDGIYVEAYVPHELEGRI